MQTQNATSTSIPTPNPTRCASPTWRWTLDVDFEPSSSAAARPTRWTGSTRQATQLVLDTRDLTIDKVGRRAQRRQVGDLAAVRAGRADDTLLGSKLTIEAPDAQRQRIRVTYATSPEASGLQWLTPAMTQGKKTPFMFSQSQQIHARSWVPLQDTPAVRFTYTAHVTAPKDVMVLMSADNDPKAARDGDYSFKMPQPIPSYLLAIAAGDLVFKPISARAGVWAEPAMVDAAVDRVRRHREDDRQPTESLYGPYRWERYDMLVLPPSFPYGGMENPRLTFITPTVIVGDKSLVSLIAHELAHSWSGNLVTFSSAKHGWLNEGLHQLRREPHRRGAVRQGTRRHGVRDLAQCTGASTSRRCEPAKQALAVRPGAELDPDDALSAVSYDKGAWFLQFLEQRFGRETFDAFLRELFRPLRVPERSPRRPVHRLRRRATCSTKHPGKVTEAELDDVDLRAGHPRQRAEGACRAASMRSTPRARPGWTAAHCRPRPVTDAWTTQEWVHFLEGMPRDADGGAAARSWTSAYAFTGTPNGEIAQRWYPLAVRSGYTAGQPAIGDVPASASAAAS